MAKRRTVGPLTWVSRLFVGFEIIHKCTPKHLSNFIKKRRVLLVFLQLQRLQKARAFSVALLYLLCFLPYASVYSFLIYTHRCFVRTNIVIDDDLMENALKASGLTTKKEVVEQGLSLLIKRKEQQGIRKLRGKVKWEGDLDEMRGRK